MIRERFELASSGLVGNLGDPVVAPVHLYRSYVKRLLDITLALLLLPIAATLLLVPVICLSARGKAFFPHWRVGRNGAAFRCWKLQTMVADADRVLAEHLRSDPVAALEWKNTHKLNSDPRITRLGRLLRKSSFDELPQLINVLRGEMSIIGPRPITAVELAEYTPDARAAYLSLSPGITGLWQTSGRNRLSFSERAAFDTEYADNLSLTSDISILLRTIPVVLAGTGG